FGLVFAVLGFGLSSVFPLTAVLAGLAGLASAAYMTVNMTVIQVSVPDDLRGRVLSVRFLVIGLSPLGMLAMGAVAEAIGPQWAVAGLAAAGAALFALVQLFARAARARAARQ
ncbi:MAG: MFS transporter, partial [Gemmatimonadetes bacterium]|nr:MFS transporter [Gemmatimonadota bacterium]